MKSCGPDGFHYTIPVSRDEWIELSSGARLVSTEDEEGE
jgi:hypothetical protein